MENTQVVVIGAGVVGLAITEALSRNRKEVVLLEQHASFGQDASSRNSEVIHAGFFCAPDTIRAKVCVEGRELLYELCRKKDIPFRKIGKLAVAQTQGDTKELERLFRQGKQNGVADLQLLSGKELRSREPHLKIAAAFHSPSSGIIDSHAYMKCLESTAEEHGAVISYGSRVAGIEKNGNGYVLEIEEPNNGKSRISAEMVINSGGLYADEIARMAGIDTEKAGYSFCYMKGEYARVVDTSRIPLEKLVYPVPHGILDIHLVIDLQGQAKLGTLNTMIEKQVDYRMLQEDAEVFYREAKTYLPQLEPGDLALDMCGIVPKFESPGDPKQDYVIQHESDRGLPGFVNVMGIGSPGLTSSLSIARHVVKLLA